MNNHNLEIFLIAIMVLLLIQSIVQQDPLIDTIPFVILVLMELLRFLLLMKSNYQNIKIIINIGTLVLTQFVFLLRIAKLQKGNYDTFNDVIVIFIKIWSVLKNKTNKNHRQTFNSLIFVSSFIMLLQLTLKYDLELLKALLIITILIIINDIEVRQQMQNIKQNNDNDQNLNQDEQPSFKNQDENQIIMDFSNIQQIKSPNENDQQPELLNKYQSEGNQLQIICENSIPCQLSPPSSNSSQFNQFKRKFQRMDTIKNNQIILLNYVPQGLMVLDKEMKILLINEKCEKFFGQEDQQNILKTIQQAVEDQYNNNSIESPKEINQFQQKSMAHKKSFIEIVNFKSESQIKKTLLLRHGLNKLSFQSQKSYASSVARGSIRSNSFSSNEEPIIKLKYEKKEQIDRKEVLLKIKIYKIRNNFNLDDAYLFISIQNVFHKQQIKQINNQIVFQNKLLQSFSHELRTPLNHNLSLLQIAKDLCINKSDLQDLIKQIYGSNTLLLYQLNTILDNAVLSSGELQLQINEFQCSDLLNEIEYIYSKPFKSKNINYVTNIDKYWQENTISSDYTRILQILVNLLDNSIKFTDQDGFIQIQIGLIERESIPTMKITVINDGQGIDEQKLGEIQKFLNGNIQAKNNFYLGLGLTVCDKIAKQLNNNQKQGLMIESIEMKETIVTFFVKNHSNTHFQSQVHSIKNKQCKNLILDESINKFNSNYDISDDEQPIDQIQIMQGFLDREIKFNKNKSKFFDEQIKNQLIEKLSIKQINQSEEIKNQPAQSPVQILVVDDIPFNHIAVENILKMKYQLIPVKAFNGRQAIDLVKERTQTKYQFKIILMDIEMPGLNGFQTTEEILKICKKYDQKTNIIMCSAYDSQENIMEAKRCGMIDFLTKPIRMKLLQNIVSQYM